MKTTAQDRLHIPFVTMSFPSSSDFKHQKLTLADEIPGTCEHFSTPNLLILVIASKRLLFSSGEACARGRVVGV